MGTGVEVGEHQGGLATGHGSVEPELQKER
jgi:hypothetical protein